MLAAHVHLVRKDQLIFGTSSEPYHLTVFQCDLCSLIQTAYTNQCTMWHIGRLLLYRFFLYYIVFCLELLLFYLLQFRNFRSLCRTAYPRTEYKSSDSKYRGESGGRQ